MAVFFKNGTCAGHHSEGIAISVVIPTRNRAAMLHDALSSLPAACAGLENAVECLVIDNGSSDATRAVVESFAASAPFPVRCIYESCPGLHAGRNLGAALAQGEILAYLDDDALVQPAWALALLKRFADDSANMIVGGPCLPKWESSPPDWIESLRTELPGGGWAIGYLSLIDMGDAPKPVSGRYIYGCNFAVRKNFVLESGGFHPDGMPSCLSRFRGDGETEMGMKVDAHPEYTAFYDPGAAILHRVPASRMTREYFADVARRSGIGAGYAAYRACGGHGGMLFRQWLRLSRELKNALKRLLKEIAFGAAPDGRSISLANLYAITAWQMFRHYVRICFSPVLRAWARQASYLPGSPCPYHKNIPSS